MEIKDHKLLGDDNNHVDFVPSPNVRPGKLKHRFVLIHGTEGPSMESTVSHFSNKDSERSPWAHLVIGRNGENVQMVHLDRIAKQGGVGEWGRIRDISKHSIGIELVNAGPLS